MQDLILNRLRNLCAVKELCRWDLCRKMDRWEVESEKQEKILEQLSKEGFWNEERFVRAFVHDRYKLQNWGPAKIRRTLQQKQVDSELVAAALGSLDDEEQLMRVQELLRKKQNQWQGLPPLKQKQRAYRFILQRGFSAHLFFKAWDQLRL